MQRYPMTPQGHAALEAELKQLKIYNELGLDITRLTQNTFSGDSKLIIN